MKRKILLLVAAEIDSALMHVAAEMHYDVRCATSTRAAHDQILDQLADVDLIVIDVDPTSEALDGLGVLDALRSHEQTPPVVVLSALEESYMTPIALDHGAATCVAKPFSVPRLRATIKEITQSDWRPAGCSCDPWGHPLHERRGGPGRWSLDLRI